jgi:pimeloyl-ACP methyl ester carboxylesterase
MAERALWREVTAVQEYRQLQREPVFHGIGVEDGAGQPVLLIPGFLTRDRGLATMADWLRRTGHRPARAHNGSNVACAESETGRLEERLEQLANRSGQRVAIVGHSRGGHLARVLAVRRPELVSGIVTLGAPPLDPLGVHPAVAVPAITVALAGAAGIPGLFRPQCFLGACCRTFRWQLHGPFPRTVGFVSVFSRRDGVVRWERLTETGGTRVEVAATHLGFIVNAEAYTVVADALKAFRRDAPGPAASG